MKKSKKKEIKQVTNSFWFLIPIIFAIAVIPLMVQFRVEISELGKFAWYTEANRYLDLFSSCKRDAIVFLDVILLGGLMYLAYKKEIPKQLALIPLGIYMVLIILSSIFTVNASITWNGFEGMRESAFVLLGYCMIFLYTYAVVKTEKQVKVVMFAFFIGVTVVCLIGVFQFLGINFYMTDFGKSLIFSKEYQVYADAMTQANTEVCSSLFNGNYMGVYCCLVIPVIAMLLFSMKEKHWMLLGYIALLAIAFACIMGSDSNTAIIILLPFFLFAFVFFMRKMNKMMFGVFAVLILLFIGINIYQGESSLVTKVATKILNDYKVRPEHVIDDIVLGDEVFSVVYKGTEVIAKYEKTEDGGYALLVEVDEKSIDIEGTNTGLGYRLVDDRLEGLYFLPIKEDGIVTAYKVDVDDERFPNAHYRIYYSESDETYYCKNTYDRYTKIYKSETIDSSLFHFMNGFSTRDFIWMKSIPILEKTVFLGSGPDTYAVMFPQYDYISIGQDWMWDYLITKPHSTYLQIGIQTGVLSLLAYLAFWIIYVVQSIRIYWKRELNTFAERCGIAIFIASFCYMVAGIVHDSYLGVAIVYWTLLGLGFACNKIVKPAEGTIVVTEELSKEKKLTIGLVTIILLLVIVIGHLLLNPRNEEYKDGRAMFSEQLKEEAK